LADSYAVRIHSHGGPEQLRYERVSVGAPGPGEVLIRHSAIGLNFTDIHHRTGRYPAGDFPITLGMEAAGRIEQIGEGVSEFHPGDRIAYGGASPSLMPGSYSELRIMRPERLVKLPDWIDDHTAAAVFLKGLTAEYLIHGAYAVQPRDTILVHAAAGGVGLLLCQWAKHLGATVIGTVSSPEKAQLALANGCSHVVISTRENVAARARELTGGRGVRAVYDSVGAATFESSLASVQKRGIVVAFGSASGPVPPLDIFRLNRMGSLFLTGAGLADYTAERSELLARASNLFNAIKDGFVGVQINQRYLLAAAAQAHEDLANRRTTGSSVILP
jgi:NADPH2:quinone reductase